MIPDISHIFEQYEILRSEADAIFSRLSGQFANEVKCHRGCSDCCHALFDLSLVEAMYINKAFATKFEHGRTRSQILERASQTDRNLTRVKRDMFRAEKDGENATQIMAKAATMRSPCPLLDEDQNCLMYDNRPIICRLYGLPMDINGQGHVCGIAGFVKGKSYPTIKLDKIHARLDDLSRNIGEAVQSRFELHDVYVPLSMALLTSYDEAYLGIGNAKED